MPIYSYKCRKCNKTTELLCCFSDKAEQEKELACDFCKSKDLEPVFRINIGSGNQNSTPADSGCGGCSGGSCSGCH